jgi:hypothetical protein
MDHVRFRVLPLAQCRDPERYVGVADILTVILSQAILAREGTGLGMKERKMICSRRYRFGRAWLLAILVVMLLLSLQAVAGAATTRHCGAVNDRTPGEPIDDSSSVTNIVATNVTCARARTVVLATLRSKNGRPPRPWRFGGGGEHGFSIINGRERIVGNAVN